MASLQSQRRAGSLAVALILAIVAVLLLAGPGLADNPYAPSRDYDLQNVRTHLWFDLDQKKIRGEVNHTLSVLRDDITDIKFDCAELKIQSVLLDGKDAKFTTTASQLIVPLVHPAKRGERHDVLIRYEGQPKKGLYFVLPDKNYPQQPKEIWTQGESEDTHFYIPIYDYPNDRTTSEMLLTVPGSWVTVSNGRLVGVKTETDGTKTWDWKQSEPLSTYLISAVAGEFVEKKDTWRGIPIRYIVPNGEESKVEATFSRTKEMLDAFSDALGVRYPWAQYAQTSVDEFVVGGMENTSATTLTARGLVNPSLAPELRWGSDGLNSHELAHQWFGDLVTCKDWANLWLNEGFATYFEHYWNEKHYGKEEEEYEFWRDQNRWFQEKRLYSVPIVTRSSENLIEYAGNIYTKGGLVLRMLREKLGDANFFQGLHAYLETNRGQNVVTADLQKALEQTTAISVDQFFHQWVYRAGAPRFEVSAAYDDAMRQVRLEVKQKQKVEGLVGLFAVPVDVEIATASGRKTQTIQVSKASESFTIATDGPPKMIVFDQGDKILKSLDFKRPPEALIYQLKNGSTVPDRADAATALGAVKDNSDVVAALGEAVQHELFWGVRAEAFRALGEIGGPEAEKWVLVGMNDEKPWAREVAAEELGNFKDDPSLGPKLVEFATSEKAYRVRAAALNSLAKIKAPNAFDTLAAAAKTDSPDDTIRQGALHAFGSLEDDRAVPILLIWMAPGKPLETRRAAIEGIAGLDKSNKEITKALISCLKEPYFDVKFTALFALGERGDTDAIPALESLLASGELPIGSAPFVQQQIAAIKAQASGKAPASHGHAHGGHGAAAEAEPAAGAQDATVDALKRIQQQMEEVNDRLSKIESQLASAKK